MPFAPATTGSPSRKTSPLVGYLQRVHAAQQRALARAARADEDDLLALRHPQVDVDQRPHVAVGTGDVPELDPRRRHRWIPMRASYPSRRSRWRARKESGIVMQRYSTAATRKASSGL